MRKVLFKRWIPVQFDGNRSQISGTGTWSSDFEIEGLFHQWASAYEEFESGPGNYTVGLVEKPDGTIIEVPPTHLKFVS